MLVLREIRVVSSTSSTIFKQSSVLFKGNSSSFLTISGLLEQKLVRFRR